MVLIVDEDADVANALVLALANEGIKARAVYSARAAREAILRLSPRTILLGDVAQELPGVELLEQIRQTGGCELIPIIYHVTDPDSKRRTRASAAGTSGFFIKGHCSTQQVVEHIKTELRRPNRAGGVEQAQ